MFPIRVVCGREISKFQTTWLEWCQSVKALRVCKLSGHIQVMWHAVILEGISTLHQDQGKWNKMNVFHGINSCSEVIFTTQLVFDSYGTIYFDYTLSVILLFSLWMRYLKFQVEISTEWVWKLSYQIYVYYYFLLILL